MLLAAVKRPGRRRLAVVPDRANDVKTRTGLRYSRAARWVQVAALSRYLLDPGEDPGWPPGVFVSTGPRRAAPRSAERRLRVVACAQAREQQQVVGLDAELVHDVCRVEVLGAGATSSEQREIVGRSDGLFVDLRERRPQRRSANVPGERQGAHRGRP